MKKINKILLGIMTIGLASPFMALADGGYEMMDENGGMWSGWGEWCGGAHGLMGWGGGLLGGLLMLLVITFLVTGVIYFWQGINKNNKHK